MSARTQNGWDEHDYRAEVARLRARCEELLGVYDAAAPIVRSLLAAGEPTPDERRLIAAVKRATS